MNIAAILFDLGYDVWFRSRENISNREKIPNHRYALKGNSKCCHWYRS